MTKLAVCPLWFVLLVSLQAQNDGYYELTTRPWNGDWMSMTRDQMVHGEAYKGYPGPLPKLFCALGLDPDHPGVDFELRFNVDRDAPSWYGQCDGLAAAAITYPVPEALVAHGIKFFPAELKALLTGIHKDGLRHAQSSPGPSGLSARVMDSLLFQYTAQNIPIIFDVDISEEIWNFPVAAFSRSSYVSGDWTEVTVDVGYTAILMMSDYEGPGEIQFETYTYKYRSADNSQYQWTNASVTEHPDLAWLPGIPYSPEIWELSADRYYNNATLDFLSQLSLEPDADRDLHEPNDVADQATVLKHQLLLGSLPPGDKDFFRFSAVFDERVDLQIWVYDGESIYVELADSTGQILESHDLVREIELDFTANGNGVYELSLSAHPDASVTAFYHIVFPEDQGFLRNEIVRQEEARWSARAINVHDGPNSVSSEIRQEVPQFGSVDFGEMSDDIRSSEQVMWVKERATGEFLEKRYAWDHEITMNAVVPHLTFRNDWDTKLEINVSDPTAQTRVLVYSRTGMLIQDAALALDDTGGFSDSLSNWLGQSAIRNGAWFEIDAGGAEIDGAVVFLRDLIGDFSRIPVRSKPLNGKMVIFDLLDSGAGWNGLALVNAAGQENELMYRLRDTQGNIVDEGVSYLAPGEKLLSTISGLVQGVEQGYFFELFSQYNVEALTIRHSYDSGNTWGHRVLSLFSDSFTETYMSVGDSWEESTLVCFNPNDRNIHLLFEGYGADGTLHGRFHTILSRAVKSFETRVAPVSQIMENGVDILDLEAITHFRLTALEPFYCIELMSHAGTNSKTVTRLVPVFDDP